MNAAGAGAKADAEEAVKLAKSGAQQSEAATGQIALGEVLWEHGDFASARSLFEEALNARRRSGEAMAIARAQLPAILEPDQGNWPAAAQLTADPPARFERVGARGTAALAGSVNAAALIADGGRVEACRMVNGLRGLAGKAEDRLDASRALILIGDVEARCGRSREARAGLVRIDLEARGFLRLAHDCEKISRQ